MAPFPAIDGASIASARFSNASRKPHPLQRPETEGRRSPATAAIAVHASAIAADAIHQDDIRTLLALALCDPPHARERFPEFRLTRLVTARLDMDDEEAISFAELAETIPSRPLSHGEAQFDEHLRAVIR